jgi:hypothetical protein
VEFLSRNKFTRTSFSTSFITQGEENDMTDSTIGSRWAKSLLNIKHKLREEKLEALNEEYENFERHKSEKLDKFQRKYPTREAYEILSRKTTRDCSFVKQWFKQISTQTRDDGLCLSFDETLGETDLEYKCSILVSPCSLSTD